MATAVSPLLRPQGTEGCITCIDNSVRACAAPREPVILLAVAGLSFSLAADARADTPNIVYILADDMGLGDIRSYNATSPVNTPNIDRIANEGMRFTNVRFPRASVPPRVTAS